LFEALPSVSILREAKEFVLIFRRNSSSDAKPSPEQMQERLNWLGSIADSQPVGCDLCCLQSNQPG